MEINLTFNELFSTFKKKDFSRSNFDLTPSGIINDLNLLEPIYKKTTNYGHFGRENQGFLWEKPIKLV